MAETKASTTSHYIDRTQPFPYGVITWYQRPSQKEGPRFQREQGSYYCQDAELFQSNTHAQSCARILSLETGVEHSVRDEYISDRIPGEKTTHRVNHRIVRTSHPLSDAQRTYYLQTIQRITK